jgi:hypothetical protein
MVTNGSPALRGFRPTLTGIPPKDIKDQRSGALSHRALASTQDKRAKSSEPQSLSQYPSLSQHPDASGVSFFPQPSNTVKGFIFSPGVHVFPKTVKGVIFPPGFKFPQRTERSHMVPKHHGGDEGVIFPPGLSSSFFFYSRGVSEL